VELQSFIRGDESATWSVVKRSDDTAKIMSGYLRTQSLFVPLNNLMLIELGAAASIPVINGTDR
jgi:hypothetical protein